MSRLLLATVLAMGAFLSTASAQEDCSDAQDQVTMNQCAGEAYRAADEQLNAKYQEITSRLGDDESARKRLVESQRAWIAYRDAECAFQASTVEGGSMHPMILSSCLEAITEKRIANFNDYLSCEEGDLRCPVPVLE